MFSLIIEFLSYGGNLHHNMYQLLGQATMQRVHVSLITKKLYIRNRSWCENVKKDSLYHISTI